MPRLINRSERSCIVHLVRPSGGLEQAVAISKASCFPSNFVCCAGFGRRLKPNPHHLPQFSGAIPLYRIIVKLGREEKGIVLLEAPPALSLALWRKVGERVQLKFLLVVLLQVLIVLTASYVTHEPGNCTIQPVRWSREEYPDHEPGLSSARALSSRSPS